MDRSDYIGRRLRPSRYLPEFFTLRHILWKVQEVVSRLENSGWRFPIRVLDAGAGCGPYRELFSAERFNYVAVDSQAIAGIAAVADGQRLPFKDGVFDLVLSNQVIEHVTDPRKVVAELQRVVSARGYILLSCPFVWEIHNFPGDYWRFSRQALELLFSDMDLLYLEPSTNTAQCLAQTFNLFLNRNLKNERLKRLLYRLVNSKLLRLLPEDTALPANYVLLARKKP